MKRKFLRLTSLLAVGTLAFTACGQTTSETSSVEEVSTTSESSEIITNLAQIDNTKWLYNEDDNVYYQI